MTPFHSFTEDVEIEGRDLEGNLVMRKFRIGLMKADIGSWVISLWRTGKMLDEANFAKAQSHAFDSCWLIKDVGDTSVPIKIYEHGGRGWLIPELAYDSCSAYFLWDEVVRVNFGPFLKKLAAELIARETAKNSTHEETQDTVLPLFRPNSTPISGVR